VRSLLQATGQEEALQGSLAMWANTVFRPFDDDEAASAALLQGKLKGYYHLPADFLEQGEISAYYAEGPGLGSGDARSHMKSLIQDKLLQGKVPPDLAVRVRTPVAQWNQWTVKASGETQPRSVIARVARILVPLLFAVLLMVSIMGSAGYLIQGTALEKENKVVEVLLSSADPQEILAGKLLGLGAAGLLQVTVWFSMIGFGGVVFAGALAGAGVEVPWLAIGVGIFFFIAGYLFLGSLMLGSGSLGSNQRESQQWSMIWALLAFAPFVFMMMFLEEPHNGMAVAMTWIPFTAPLTVILRMTLDPPGIAWWEIVGSFVVLVVSTYVAILFGARLFRVGLLLTGARPKLREILRQARLGN
jgi:ABC-2 type transport system permease protein